MAVRFLVLLALSLCIAVSSAVEETETSLAIKNLAKVSLEAEKGISAVNGIANLSLNPEKSHDTSLPNSNKVLSAIFNQVKKSIKNQKLTVNNPSIATVEYGKRIIDSAAKLLTHKPEKTLRRRKRFSINRYNPNRKSGFNIKAAKKIGHLVKAKKNINDNKPAVNEHSIKAGSFIQAVNELQSS